MTPQARATIEDIFRHRSWDNQQQDAAAQQVHDILAQAAGIVVGNVPPSPDRTVALRQLRECAMNCDSAILNGGKY
jgi:hypothetical protein